VKTRPLVTAMTLATLLTVAVDTPAQTDLPTSPADLAAYCQRQPCRKDAVVQVRLPDGRVQEERSTLYRPAVTRGSVSIPLGEELRVVPDFDDLDFQGWRAAERRESARTPVLTFKMTQSTSDGSVSIGISNSGREPVKLRLSIRSAGAAAGEYTSSCPVPAGGTVYEYWSQPVVEVIVNEAALLSDDAALLCD
jgi:hypothetical protein